MVGGPLGSRPARRGVIFGVVTLVVLFGAFVPLGLRSSATSPFGMLHLALLGAAQAIVSPFRGRRRWIFAVAWPLGSLVVAPLSGTFDRFTIANGGILQNGARFGLEDGPAHVSFIPVFLVQALIVGGGVGRRIVWFVVASVPVVLPALSMVHDLRQAAAGCLALAAFQGIACWLWCRADVRASARASVRPDR